VPRLKFITMCGAIRSLKYTYAGSFIIDLRRKFLFLEFATRKRNIFSRSGIYRVYKKTRPLEMKLLLKFECIPLC
jgi:hypothetical protein